MDKILQISVIIGLLVGVLTFALHIFMYQWTNKLEEQNCDCSDLWHRNIVNKLAIGLIGLFLVNSIIFRGNIPNNKLYLTVCALIGFAYFGIIIDYIRKLKQKNCECSEDWKREYGYIFISYLIFIALLILIIFLVHWLIGNNKEYISAIEEAQKEAKKLIKEAKATKKSSKKSR